MCYFISIGVKKDVADKISTIDNRDFHIISASNTYTADIIGKEFESFFVIRGGHCSCDIYYSSEKSKKRDEEKIRRKYEKKGWSESKIARALKSSEDSINRISEPNELYVRFLEDVSSIAREAGGIRLFVHYYSGAVGDEKVAALGKQVYTVEEFLSLKEEFPEDTLITVTP